MRSLKDTLTEAIKHGWSPKQLRRKKAGKKVYEGSEQVDEAKNHKESAVIDSIVECLKKGSVIEDICDAADRGMFDIHSFIDEYGEDILIRIERALMECWDENF